MNRVHLVNGRNKSNTDIPTGFHQLCKRADLFLELLTRALAWKFDRKFPFLTGKKLQFLGLACCGHF